MSLREINPCFLFHPVFFQSRAFITLVLLTIAFPASILAQNLVKNPSFEAFESCSKKLGNIDDCEFWTNPVLTNPDYYNSCSDYFYTSTPINIAGKQYPRSGSAYAGIIVYQKGEEWSEYLQGELTQELEKGKDYEISFYVSAAELSEYFSDLIGVYFSAEPIEVEEYSFLPKNPRQMVSTRSGYYFDNTDSWRKVTATYTAVGGEKYLVLGNITNNSQRRKLPENPATEGLRIEDMAYVYIDDVTLLPHDFSHFSDSANEFADQELSVGTVGILTGTDDLFLGETEVIVDPDRLSRRYGLGIESELIIIDYFIYFMTVHPDLIIEIGVHTDDFEEDEEENVRMSQARADAVVAYMFKHGIPRERLVAKGYGSSSPLNKNRNEDEMERNRRVSYKVLASGGS